MRIRMELPSRKMSQLEGSGIEGASGANTAAPQLHLHGLRLFAQDARATTVVDSIPTLIPIILEQAGKIVPPNLLAQDLSDPALLDPLTDELKPFLYKVCEVAHGIEDMLREHPEKISGAMSEFYSLLLHVGGEIKLTLFFFERGEPSSWSQRVVDLDSRLKRLAKVDWTTLSEQISSPSDSEPQAA